MHDYQQHQHALALRYGLDLPKPSKPKVSAPGFLVGSCSRMVFSPDGAHLVVPTANGTWLWDVATGTRGPKLAVPANPSGFLFSADGSVLLVRNEQSQFARLAMPSGDELGRFRAQYELRMDGAPGLGPDNRTVVQFAYEGLLLVLDGDTGKVLLQRQLERTGCSAEIWWNAAAGEFILSQTSVHGDNKGGWPCALWRWKWPLDQHEPQRLPGKWSGLHTQWLARHGLLLMHHQPDPKQPAASVIEVVDARTFEIVRRIDCASAIRPQPTLSHDLSAWAVATHGGVEVDDGTQRWTVPLFCGFGTFSPTQDLLATSGPVGVVAPLAQWPGLLPVLQVKFDEEELQRRAYARFQFYPDRKLPPRLVVYARDGGWLLEPEAIAATAKYSPQAEAIAVPATSTVAQRVEALERAIACARDGSRLPEIARGVRHCGGGVLTPPAGTWSSAVVVSLGPDAIDLWPLKPKGDLAFEQQHHPASLPPQSDAATLWRAVERMLLHFKPRRAGKG